MLWSKRVPAVCQREKREKRGEGERERRRVRNEGEGELGRERASERENEREKCNQTLAVDGRDRVCRVNWVDRERAREKTNGKNAVKPWPLTGAIESQREALAGPPGFCETSPAIGGSGLRSLKADWASRPYSILSFSFFRRFFFLW